MPDYRRAELERIIRSIQIMYRLPLAGHVREFDSHDCQVMEDLADAPISTRRSSSARRKPRDLVWVTKIAEFSATDLGIVGGEIMSGPDWDPSGSQSFERGTLLRIVGTVLMNQTGNATSADVPVLAWMLYKDAQGLGASLVDPYDAANIYSTDILH